MAKVIWTKRALNDLENIAEYISKDSLHYAKLTLEKIIDTELVIENNHKIGRIVPELNDPNIREFIKGSFRIIYQILNTSQLNILTVFHSSRLFSEEDIK